MRMRPSHAFLVLLVAVSSVTGCSSASRAIGGGPSPDGAPASFVGLGLESGTAYTIQVRDGLSRAAAWRALTDYLSQRHTIVVRDQNAGFAMTAWEASFTRDGVPDLRYRTRVVITYLGDWRQLHVRAEANWKAGDDWQVGVDRDLLSRTVGELQARVGAAGAR
jgi:hypothetical protein